MLNWGSIVVYSEWQRRIRCRCYHCLDLGVSRQKCTRKVTGFFCSSKPNQDRTTDQVYIYPIRSVCPSLRGTTFISISYKACFHRYYYALIEQIRMVFMYLILQYLSILWSYAGKGNISKGSFHSYTPSTVSVTNKLANYRTVRISDIKLISFSVTVIPKKVPSCFPTRKIVACYSISRSPMALSQLYHLPTNSHWNNALPSLKVDPLSAQKFCNELVNM